MADLITGDTQLAATKQAVIAAVVAKELAFQAKLAPFFTDYSSWAVKGAKSVSVPKAGSLTAVDRATGVQGDASVLTFAADLIPLDRNMYVAWIIDSSDEVQSRVEVQAEYARRAASAIGRAHDVDSIALLQTAPVTTTVGNISQAIILEMRQSLLAAFADMNQLYLAVGPDQEAKLLAIAEFVRSDSYGRLPTALQTGVIGQIYGINVVVHAGIAAGNYYMWEKTGVYFANQLQPSMSSQGANEFGSSALRNAMDFLYGHKLGQAGLYLRDNNP